MRIRDLRSRTLTGHLLLTTVYAYTVRGVPGQPR
jgi:hypothetical protein